MSDVEDKTSPIKLLLIRTPWYNIGLVVLVTGILIVLNQCTTRVPYIRFSVMINYTITILISLCIILCTMNCNSLYTGLVILDQAKLIHSLSSGIFENHMQAEIQAYLIQKSLASYLTSSLYIL